MKPRKWIRKEIELLHPEMDYARIVDILMNWRDRNPFIHHLLYTLLFIRTVAVPSIAVVIYGAGVGRMIKATAARADETLAWVGTWYRYGPESEQGRQSIARLNAIHQRFSIPNDEHIYTLCTFLVTPDRFRRQIGLRTRPLHEHIALTKFWRTVGTLMNITDIPESWEDFQLYYDTYEKERFKFSEEGMKCTEALIDEFVHRWFRDDPKKGRTFLLANFDANLRAVFLLDYLAKFRSFFLLRYFSVMGIIRRLNRPDPQSARYVEDSFNPKRPRE